MQFKFSLRHSASTEGQSKNTDSKVFFPENNLSNLNYWEQAP